MVSFVGYLSMSTFSGMFRLYMSSAPKKFVDLSLRPTTLVLSV
jgi:hypothetical protein